MGRAIAIIAESAVAALPLAGLAAFWRNIARDLVEGYHPERHYMRGPGPACRAKTRKS